MQIGAKISLRRLQKGMTQQELAVAAGIPQPNLSNIEKGKQDLTVSTLRRIGYALDIRLSDFFAEEEARAQKEIRFTRSEIEKLAQAIVAGGVILNEAERQIVALFRQVLPKKIGRPSGIKKTQEAWIRLRQTLSASQIKGIHQRIRDFEARTL